MTSVCNYLSRSAGQITSALTGQITSVAINPISDKASLMLRIAGVTSIVALNQLLNLSMGNLGNFLNGVYIAWGISSLQEILNELEKSPEERLFLKSEMANMLKLAGFTSVVALDGLVLKPVVGGVGSFVLQTFGHFCVFKLVGRFEAT